MINFKQPRYVLPIIAFPFLILSFYAIKGAFGNSEEKKSAFDLKEKDGFSIEIPDPNMDDVEFFNKFEAVKEAYKKKQDYSAVQEIEKEEKTLIDNLDNDSLYSATEMRRIDSLNKINREEERRYQRIQESYQNYSPPNTFSTSNQPPPNPYEREDSKSEYEKELDLFKAQMRYLDSLERSSLEHNQAQEEILPGGELVKEPERNVVRVQKEKKNNNAFNTIGDNADKTPYIKAIIDETVKVRINSRVRFRLLDDVKAGDLSLKKDSYLYGVVTSFKPERVVVSIPSLVAGGQIVEVDLSVFNTDGLEGIYVPNSQFRDLTKDAGGNVASNNISFDESPQNAQAMVMDAVQDVYRSTSKSISKAIKKNKAVLKYNTVVYLINN